MRLCKFLSPIQSDHSPVVLKISSCAKSDLRGRGYRKFNNWKFVESLQDDVKTVSSTFKDGQDPCVNWEFLKYKILRFSKYYGMKKQKRERENGLFLKTKC